MSILPICRHSGKGYPFSLFATKPAKYTCFPSISINFHACLRTLRNVVTNRGMQNLTPRQQAANCCDVSMAIVGERGAR
jgi:hypothetical protein